MAVKSLNRGIIAAAVVGVLVSSYALYVEMAAEARPGYKALCDIAEHASCSRVLTSKYAKGLGLVPKNSQLEVPNCAYGIIFYCIMIFLSTFDLIWVVRLQMVISLLSVGTCFYLAYILIFILRDFCIVCVSTYFVNAFILYFINEKHKLLFNKEK